MTAPGRLPREVVPRRYDLTVRADLDQSRFDGDVTIELELLDTTDHIVLNAQDLEVELDRLTVGGLTVDPATVRLRTEPDHEQIVIELPNALEPGSAELDLRF